MLIDILNQNTPLLQKPSLYFDIKFQIAVGDHIPRPAVGYCVQYFLITSHRLLTLVLHSVRCWGWWWWCGLFPSCTLFRLLTSLSRLWIVFYISTSFIRTGTAFVLVDAVVVVGLYYNFFFNFHTATYISPSTASYNQQQSVQVLVLCVNKRKDKDNAPEIRFTSITIVIILFF